MQRTENEREKRIKWINTKCKKRKSTAIEPFVLYTVCYMFSILFTHFCAAFRWCLELFHFLSLSFNCFTSTASLKCGFIWWWRNTKNKQLKWRFSSLFACVWSIAKLCRSFCELIMACYCFVLAFIFLFLFFSLAHKRVFYHLNSTNIQYVWH